MMKVDSRGGPRTLNPTARPLPPQGGRKPWRVILVLVVLAALVWLAPGVVAHTPLLAWAVRKAARLDGTLTIQSASLGWFSPVRVSGIEVHDAQSQSVLELAEVASEKSLFALVRDLSSVGSLRLEKPKLTVVLRKGGSNVEDLLARWQKSESKAHPCGFSVEVVDGSVTVVDQETRETWQVDHLRVDMSMSPDCVWPTRLESTAAVGDARGPGSLSVRLRLRPRKAPARTRRGSRRWRTPRASCSWKPRRCRWRCSSGLPPGWRRNALAGMLRSKLEVQWTGSDRVGLQGEIVAGALSVADPSLGKDVVRLDRARVACKAVQQGGRLEIQESTVECDLGSLTATGATDLGDGGLAALPSRIWRQTCDVRGQLDLARLARLIPGTLHLRAGTEITSGQVQLAVHSGPVEAAGTPHTVWQAQLEASHLAGVAGGRQARMAATGPARSGRSSRGPRPGGRRHPVRVRLPETQRGRHVRQTGRLDHLQLAAAGRLLGPVR